VVVFLERGELITGHLDCQQRNCRKVKIIFLLAKILLPA
jgi:hypothetical protein